MKKKTLNFIVPLVIYPFSIMVSLGQSDYQLRISLTKSNLEWEERMKLTGEGKCILLASNNVVVRTSDFPKSPEQMGSLQHEIFHAVAFVMWRIGMELEIDKSEEAYAYLIGYLTKEIYTKL